MERRTFIALLGTASASVLASCGSDGTTLPTAEPSTVPGEEPAPTTDVPAPPPSDASDVTVAPTETPAESMGAPILTLTSEGGFTTRDFAFQNPASIIVTDAGRMITLADDASFDAVLLAHEERTIDADGIAALREMLDEAGLFDDVEYSRDDFIADAATTTLVVVDEAGREYRHEAYALATGGGLPGDPASSETDPDRAALAAVVSSLVNDVASIVGAASLGPVSPWVPSALQITVEGTSGADISPDANVVDWPDSADLRLDDDRILDTFACAEVADPIAIESIMAADGQTFFRDATVDGPDDVFRVVARPAYPGRTCDT